MCKRSSRIQLIFGNAFLSSSVKAAFVIRARVQVVDVRRPSKIARCILFNIFTLCMHIFGSNAQLKLIDDSLYFVLAGVSYMQPEHYFAWIANHRPWTLAA